MQHLAHVGVATLAYPDHVGAMRNFIVAYIMQMLFYKVIFISLLGFSCFAEMKNKFGISPMV